jgi:hypothetical protein
MENQKQETGTLTDMDIIKHAGWAKSSGLPASRNIYYAADINGDVARALKALGFREGQLTDKFHYKISTSASTGGFGAMTSGPDVIILPETKKILDDICNVDVACPEHREVKQPTIQASAVSEIEQGSVASRG